MQPTKLTIRRGNQNWQVNLDPEGAIIGRRSTCDVVIDSPDVSRRHAKVFCESSDRWMIEDLGSSNGTFVNGRRAASCPISPGDIIEIGPVRLSLGQAPEHWTTIPSQPELPNIIVEDFGTEVFYSRPRIEECTRQPCAERLKNIRQRLSELPGQDAVYSEICRALTQSPKTAAAIFRLPAKAKPMPSAPDVLAYHFGSSPGETHVGSIYNWHPSHHGFRVSHRLLEAVRTDEHPLMTKSIFSCDDEITISLIDEHCPRALICTPLGSVAQAVDLLYVDVPIDERTPPGPEEMFAFVQAVARQVQAATSRIS